MKSTGIIRSVDSLGRFVLPKELRDSFGITTDTPIEIFTDGNTILLRKYRADGCCDLCGEVTGDSILFRGRLRAASSFAHGGKGTKTPPGTAQMSASRS
mgnify:CR=1 FL=1